MFDDASDIRLCVVAYLRIEVDDDVRVSFVMGKRRLALITTTTTPKLERQATLPAFAKKVSPIEGHDFTIDQVFMWSDSTTVLRWLNSFDKKHQQFVANRLGEFLENTKLDEWNQISGIQNPAELWTPDLRTKEIAASVWPNGPVSLQEKEEIWLKATIDSNNVEDTSEPSENQTLMSSKTLEIQWD